MKLESIEVLGRACHVIRPVRPTGDVVIVLHGSRQSGKVIRRFSAEGFDDLAKAGWAVCYPDGVARHWNDDRVHLREKTRDQGTDDLQFLKAVFASQQAKRCFAVGFSNGGIMTLSLLYRAPGLLSGAALLSAPHPAEENWRCWDAQSEWVPTPLLCQHGLEDPIVAFEGGKAGMPGQDRGELMGFWDSCALLSRLNGSGASLEALALAGQGHVIPTPNPVRSPLLGPASGKHDVPQAVRRFFLSL
ncbi:poly(3-hydroxyalkanoate) depolymerase [Corynebacterium gerontici]|uniref:Phospholipase/Carboxylesterase n=1 Tax=Corynebacterium gerontici TaxID=2079234 RepID=A0A3G6J2R1_9CORY|nr:poly(3-hydroxyalkanoate) depolymerase [Corynebacterium gerontici]AZA10690.1 Phospholipase/Carboxylesterase [Corynebacterium gerontici]